MFYRQKIMLSLLEVFGGELENTEFEKLMFLFCQETGKEFYSFIPYAYGAFSFDTYHDKRKLIEKGFLRDEEDFVLNREESFAGQLKNDDKRDLREFALKNRAVSSRDLIRETYLSYPYYAIRSKIVHDVLTVEEQKLIEKAQPKASKIVLYTLGYEGLTIDAYLDRLIRSDIKAVIDVRKNPLSMKYGFSRKTLKSCLEKLDIAYFHVPELGIESSKRKGLENKSDYESLFKYYGEHVLKGNTALETVRQLLSEYKRIALTCFEKDPDYCHRSKISDWFDQHDNKLAVSHL